MANEKVYIYNEDNIRINVYEEAQPELQLINDNPSIEIVRIYEPGAQGPKGNDGGEYVLPENVVSSSQQIASDISGSFVSASSALSERISTFESKTLFSGSSQVIYSQISSIPSNIVSGSDQISSSYDLKYELKGRNVVSSSQQIKNNLPDGTISSSQQLPSGLISSSVQLNSNFESKGTGILSSSEQIASDISGSFVSVSNSLSNRIEVFEGKTLFSASQQINFQDISGSFSTSSFLQNSFTASFNSFSSSAETRIFRLESVTSSFVNNSSTSSLLNNSYSASNDSRVQSLESVTGSFALKTEVSGAFTSTSASLSNRIEVFEGKTLFSGSNQVYYSGLSNIPSGIVSSSDQISSSYDLKYETRGRGIISSSNGFFSSSAQVDYNSIQNKPTTILSASYAITASYVSGSSSTSISASYALTASYALSTPLPVNLFSASQQVDFNGIINKPTLVSGSSQVSYLGILDVPANLVSGSDQLSSSYDVKYESKGTGIVSSSQQINTGSFSGSFTGDGQNVFGVISSSYALSASYAPPQVAVSASYAVTASYALNGGGSGTNIQTIGIRIKTEDTYIIEGSKGYKHIGYNSNIIKVRSIANIAGNININVKRDGTLLGNYNLTSASSSIDTTLTGWTTALNVNDLIEFSVSQSSTYITDITFFMDLQSV